MATQFNSNYAAAQLKIAADLINGVMSWQSTEEGFNYWADHNAELRVKADEARSAGLNKNYHAAMAADLIESGISWADQPEGAKYWGEVVEKLRKIATQAGSKMVPASNTGGVSIEAAPDAMASIRARLAAVKKGQQDSA